MFAVGGRVPVETEEGVAEIPDHGDLWRVEWRPKDQGSVVRDKTDAVALVGECFSFPLELERTLALTERRGLASELEYKLTNTGSKSVAVVVGGASIVCGRGGRPDCVARVDSALRLEGSGGGRLGKNGDTVAWPMATLERRQARLT